MLDSTAKQKSSELTNEQVSRAPKVSILVPIFNVEKYLEQCLDSLVNQTLLDIEIICINDGSTDASLQIIERFARADSRIQVINKENSGYGASMNRGLSQARGEFIGIVESDDFAELDMFECLYTAAMEHDVPVVRGDYYFTWTETSSRDYPRSFYKESCYGRVFDPMTEQTIFHTPPAIWNGIYQRCFLEAAAIRFLESPGASFQDTGFNYKVLMATSALYLVNKPLLHYRQDNTASSVKATTKIYAVADEIRSVFDFIEQFPAKRATLRRIMQSIAYQTYRWNIVRIDKEYRLEFCEFMYEWFDKARAADELEREYFLDDFYGELQLLLASPERYLQRINSRVNTVLSANGRNVLLTVKGSCFTFSRVVARKLGLS